MVSFDNSYAKLPDVFHAHVVPAKLSAPRLLAYNSKLAVELGLEPTPPADAARIFAGQLILEGAEPIATAYAGHQFGHFTPRLGDGRAILLGEVLDPEGGRHDIQLKGSGPTPFSRRGDGLAAMGPVLREYLVSEAMAALGIPTTRALAAVATGETVARDKMLPGAILTRVAASHIRVGTFQYFAARGDTESLRLLADHAIARHYPDAATAPSPCRAFLDGVIVRQARLVAQWLLVGFIHGVMNTDNMSISGETIDYGPCAFMDAYNPAAVFSSIDEGGRYAYANQPKIAAWNLARLAEALLPLLSDDQDQGIAQANEALDGFAGHFNVAYLGGLLAKLGLQSELEGDEALAKDLLAVMAANQADFTLTFRGLCSASAGAVEDEAVRDLFIDPTAFDDWAVRWHARLAQEPMEPEVRRAAMQNVNPAFIPRNHLVEAMIEAAIARDDFAPFEEMQHILAKPYEDQPEFSAYAAPPPLEFGPYKTFCGT
jgi:uncharacterized protein YdiU (UPF0061 family)